MSKILFIGGVADGKMVDVKDTRIDDDIKMVVPPPLPTHFAALHETNKYTKTSYDVVTYSPKKWHMENENGRIVYALKGMSYGEVFDALIDGYKKPEQEVKIGR